MSSESRPISPTRFAAALKELPLSSLYGKAAELRNSMTHLVASNDQLLEFAATDKDCADAIRENDVVLQRMEERILLLQFEVEVTRGLKWVEPGQEHQAPPPTVAVEDAADDTSYGDEGVVEVTTATAATTANGNDLQPSTGDRSNGIGQASPTDDDGEHGIHL
jgi:hypothetical protein